MSNFELEITSKAYIDIETIADYIAKDKKSTTNKMVKLFYKTFVALTEHQNLGKARTDLTTLDAKFYVVKKNYLIVYKIT